jgi:N6-adenosine-specific RNA methylase IME4
MDALELRENAKQQLMQIRDIETGMNYLNKVKAIETWAKAEKKDAELQNIIAEQKIRTQRILGTLLKESEVTKNRERNLKQNTEVTNNDFGKKLSDFGITKNESSTFQKIAELPEELFEKEIAIAKDESKKRVELTTSRVLNAAKVFEKEKKKEEYNERILLDTDNEKKINIYETKNKFRIVYADPAWMYNDKQDIPNLGGAKKHYDSMSIKELCLLPIKEITEENAVLFIWVTSPILEECFNVINAWGFKYKSSFVWDKVQHNMGHYNSVRHEFLLIATKGSCTPDNKKLYDSVRTIEKTSRHSQKPEEFLDIIDDLYTHGNRIELFCRENNKNNWNVWGNEI